MSSEVYFKTSGSSWTWYCVRLWFDSNFHPNLSVTWSQARRQRLLAVPAARVSPRGATRATPCPLNNKVLPLFVNYIARSFVLAGTDENTRMLMQQHHIFMRRFSGHNFFIILKKCSTSV